MAENNIKFTHLHLHTEYSLLDGSAKLSELVDRVAELGMDSVAVTDHGAMYGAVEFYKKAKEKGVKPIIGCEVYVANGSRLVKENAQNSNNYYHLVLLAETNEGYQNLIKLVSYGFIDGFYYKPRIDLDLLRKYSKGLIGSSACLAGQVPRTLLQSNYEKAKEVALEYNEIFGQGNFFLELQDHGIREQKLVNQHLIRMSQETGIELICTNDSHYIYKDDSKPHDVLLCIQTGKTINDENRMRYEGSEFYVKSPEEMLKLFPDQPQALENTHKIAERCNVDFVFHELKLPKFDVPDGKTPSQYLREVCQKGFDEKYPNATAEVKERLEYELSTIESMGYVDYFLIVWDFIKFAKDNDIIVGPGRGSAAGSIVSYCLSITTIDPLKYDLIFERFLNPERVSMPDIDIDFCYERRQEVIDYVINKYGEDKVAQIITFGTMAARGVIKDVGRALAMPYADVDRVSKMIPFELGITIDKALVKNPELAQLYDDEENVRYLIDMAKRLEGLPRHSSTHAAGVVICQKPVMEYVPLSSNDGTIATQYTMNTLEELGLLKMDFLGLRTLTVIQNALKEVKRTKGIDIDINTVDDSDPNVYNLIAQGNTEGIFQLESAGMKKFMKELQPNRLEDLIAGISLYRPGPMDFIPKYVKGKNSKGNIQYTHPSLQPILETTYGCIVYQEQVMQIVRDLAGYSLGRSDLVRRAMSKKKTDVMAMERQKFIYGDGEDVPGCVAKDIPVAAAEKIFDEMTDFAKYAFNKSHAAAYAVVGYQTAWLKTYYPVEFMAALMTSVMDNTDKVSGYIEECKKMGVSLIPPDINHGYAHFSVDGDKIRFGLGAIKSLGRSAIDYIVKEREANGNFVSMTDFCNRIEGGDVNKRAIESLIKGGAFDSLGGARSQYMGMYKYVIDGVAQARKNNIEGQLNIFDIMNEGQEQTVTDDLPNIAEYPIKERLAMEKEVLGIYVSGHPLAEFEKKLSRTTSCTSYDINFIDEDGTRKIEDEQKVIIGGMVSGKRLHFTKNNKVMAFVKLEDIKGCVEILVFPNVYETQSIYLNEESVVVVHGRASVSPDEESKIIVDKIVPIERYGDYTMLGVVVGKDNDTTIDDVVKIVSKYKGETPLYIHEFKTDKKFKAPQKYWVDTRTNVKDELIKFFGKDCVILK